LTERWRRRISAIQPAFEPHVRSVRVFGLEAGNRH